MAMLPLLPSSPSGPSHPFTSPSKCIHDGPDVQFFQQSLAYRDIMTFILQLNRSVVPRRRTSDGSILEFRLDTIQESDLRPQIISLRTLITELQNLIAEAPPDTGPRRFGNVSFRKWYQIVEVQIDTLLSKTLPESLHPAIIELKPYLLGSFGSPQRLDYGTGHEVSFLAFLACLWKLDYFAGSSSGPAQDSNEESKQRLGIEQQIVLSVFAPYLTLVHTVITTYNLEPAGSHGVWGLDDNSFLPYVFGSAQLASPLPSPETSPPTPTPTSGSLPSAPEPGIVTKSELVAKEATHNLYFTAIQFIHTVKRGPFWEHSPMLFDISGIKDGWGKINKGMIKMYQAEVLSKFPVVQHFVFGSLLKWERDPEAKEMGQTTHVASQPLRDPTASGGGSVTSMRPPGYSAGTAAPWSAGPGAQAARVAPAPMGFVNGVTQAPWARSDRAGAAIGSSTSRIPSSMGGASSVSASGRFGNTKSRGPRGQLAASTTLPNVRPAAGKMDSISESKGSEENTPKQ